MTLIVQLDATNSMNASFNDRAGTKKQVPTTLPEKTQQKEVLCAIDQPKPRRNMDKK
jgi:hypothetical protein